MKKYQIQRNVNGELKTFTLTPEEVDYIIKEEDAKNILEDTLSIIKERNNLSQKDEELIRSDKYLIQRAYEHEMDCDLSYWQNISRGINYMMDYATEFDYSKLKI